jgi:putative phage-type endonuclease
MSWLEQSTDDNHQVQGSKAWHDFRAKHIGASEVSTVLGESDFQTPYQLWMIKTGQAEPVKSNWAMQRGTDAEPEIKRLYEELYNVNLVSPVMEYSKWPVLSASLDGYSSEIRLVVEMKYPSKAKHELALQGLVPSTYRAQLQTQMLVAECDTAHYVSYDGKEIAVVVVKSDPIEQERILIACKEFWECVHTKTPPKGAPVILESETLDVLSKRYKQLVRIAAQTEDEIKLIRQKFDEIIEEDKASFNGVSFIRSERKGAVDYSKIPELKEVDLEAYRKSPSKTLIIKVQDE